MQILIISAYKSLEKFQQRVDNRTLLWGLDQANIHWTLTTPWKKIPDLTNYDAVMMTLHAPFYRNYIFYCSQLEAQCEALSIPVINSSRMVSPPHSYFLQKWKEAGIPCADYQLFTDFDQVQLNYPLILRVDGVHRGLSMYFVKNREEALKAIENQNNLYHRYYPSADCPKPLNIAIEFVETKKTDGMYEKKRCYVVGERIIPAHLLRSGTPFVNYKDSLLDPLTCSLDKNYTLWSEFADDEELILKAAKITGFEIITLDYSIKEDGSYVFWEGNRRRATAGDARIKWLGLRPPDIAYGHAVADYIRERVHQLT